jgi:hypothetical protein
VKCETCGQEFDPDEAESKYYCSPNCRPCEDCGYVPTARGCRCDDYDEDKEAYYRGYGW